MKAALLSVSIESQEELAGNAVELSKRLVRAMVICTCAAYERLDDFQEILDELENMSTPLGQKFIQRTMPIITRRHDTVELFSKDMMLAARDVVQESFSGLDS
jgi:hypothetical protein